MAIFEDLRLRGQGQGQGLEASRPRTSKCVLEDSTSDKNLNGSYQNLTEVNLVR